mmetsp:Transcript_13197/g.17948  ORF Transcript_13197/g.17948 Transcript_13197/m.17948 type:complete len:86 (+) Transcript_13197:1124-1381(+)
MRSAKASPGRKNISQIVGGFATQKRPNRMRQLSKEERLASFMHPSARVYSINPVQFNGNRQTIYIVPKRPPAKDLAVVGAAKPSY